MASDHKVVKQKNLVKNHVKNLAAVAVCKDLLHVFNHFVGTRRDRVK